MRRLLLAAIVFSSVAHAEIIKCPERYPTKDVALSADAADGGGTARVRPARLSGAYFESGPLYVPPTVPLITKVKGGWDTEYLFGPPEYGDPRWLICRYGGQQWGEGEIERWEKLPQHFTRCFEQVRGTKIPGTTSIAWTQTAICK